ncbi:phosphatase PAP2 family protein [Bacillus sp. FJAT-49736]|uniref:phosphatase PAP2 family protein n=1 Tax=Bacillus sp. FJAT-49736 TaxID=2833582 RepID=UPI001BC975B4|nr:phosphatase PAP2 family protein [Bacillus sp. FJAT-49736]MBS4174426.1 inositol phosphorylceramide synthase [Bacillus sp. FJAT-49736]
MNRKTIPSHLMALCWLLSIPLLGTLYVLINRQKGKAYSLVTDFDRHIPFIKIFILPYVSWFVFILAAMVYLCVKNRQVYYRTLIYFNIGLLVCYGVYSIFQTSVPRPTLTGHDLLTNMVRSVYKLDEPYNCFPSTHVLTSYLILRGFQSAKNIPRKLRMGVSFMSLLIMVSILFVKQHVVFDLIGGVAVVEVIYFLHRWGALKIKSLQLAGKHRNITTKESVKSS